MAVETLAGRLATGRGGSQAERTTTGKTRRFMIQSATTEADVRLDKAMEGPPERVENYQIRRFGASRRREERVDGDLDPSQFRSVASPHDREGKRDTRRSLLLTVKFESLSNQFASFRADGKPRSGVRLPTQPPLVHRGDPFCAMMGWIHSPLHLVTGFQRAASSTWTPFVPVHLDFPHGGVSLTLTMKTIISVTERSPVNPKV
ncbi:MAG: DNA-binding transcription factor [Chaenotheca gracillima]|nr:MAG: DNA-binding transcription factor [Chaenotheca gracillima]